MRTQAAVLYQAGTDWKVEEIELDPPRAGEVLVRVAAAGLCHSEEHHRVGDIPFAGPMIGGHEGAGYVEAVGPGVSLAKPGDYIVFSSIPKCGRCPSCVRGRQNLCDVAAGIMTGRQISDGGSRHRNLAGQDLTITCLVGCYARHIFAIDPVELKRASALGFGATQLALSGLAQWRSRSAAASSARSTPGPTCRCCWTCTKTGNWTSTAWSPGPILWRALTRATRTCATGETSAESSSCSF